MPPLIDVLLPTEIKPRTRTVHICWAIILTNERNYMERIIGIINVRVAAVIRCDQEQFRNAQSIWVGHCSQSL